MLNHGMLMTFVDVEQVANAVSKPVLIGFV